MKHEYLDKIKKQLDENKNCEVALFLLREEDSEEGAGVSVRIKSIFVSMQSPHFPVGILPRHRPKHL